MGKCQTKFNDMKYPSFPSLLQRGEHVLVLPRPHPPVVQLGYKPGCLIQNIPKTIHQYAEPHVKVPSSIFMFRRNKWLISKLKCRKNNTLFAHLLSSIAP